MKDLKSVTVIKYPGFFKIYVKASLSLIFKRTGRIHYLKGYSPAINAPPEPPLLTIMSTGLTDDLRPNFSIRYFKHLIPLYLTDKRTGLSIATLIF